MEFLDDFKPVDPVERMKRLPGQIGGVLIRLADRVPQAVTEAPAFMSNHYRPNTGGAALLDEQLQLDLEGTRSGQTSPEFNVD